MIHYAYTLQLLRAATNVCISTWHSMIPGNKHQMYLHGSYREAAKFKCICLKNQIRGVQQSVTKHIKGNLNINKLATTTLQFDAETVQHTAELKTFASKKICLRYKINWSGAVLCANRCDSEHPMTKNCVSQILLSHQ